MDKSLLRSIERPVADEKLISFARKIGTKGRKTVITQIRDVGNEILQLSLFQVSDLCEGKTAAVFRIFLSVSAEGDYITQDLTVATTKWLTGKLDTIFSDSYFNCWHPWYSNYGNVRMADPESWRLLIEAFGPPINEYWWRSILDWQDDRLERLLAERHRKECEVIDAEMDRIPELPSDFGEWIREEVLAPYRYFMYVPSRKKTTRAYCTWCKTEMEIDQRKIKPRRDNHGICPVCKSHITFKTAHSQLNKDNQRWCAIIQKTDDGFVGRYFNVYIDFEERLSREDPLMPDYQYGTFENCRAVYRPGKDLGWKPKIYEWGVYKQRGNSRWCPDMDKWNCTNAVLYTRNLPEAFAGTPFQYCSIDILQKKRGTDYIPVFRYVGNFMKKPYLEYFVKMGLTNLAADILTDWKSPHINGNGKTPAEILGISKPYIKVLCTMNGDDGVLSLLKQYEADGVLTDPDEVRRWIFYLGKDDETLGLVNAHRKQMSVNKFLNWVQKNGNGHWKELVRDWKDYISWCAMLGKDLTDLYYLLPPDFQKAHDRTLAEYKAQKEKLAKEAIRKMNLELKKLAEKSEGVDALHMSAGGLQIIIPKDDADIRREGELQHHCVATYIDRVAKGETMILFVRKTEAPTVPYFTMEYKNGHVEQCRGFRNCAMPKEVNLFVKAFEKKMQEEGRNKRKRVRIRA